MHHRAKGQTTGLQTKELWDKLQDNDNGTHYGTAGLQDKLWDRSYNRIQSGPIANRTDNGFTGQQDHRINHGTMELWDKLRDCGTTGQRDYRTNYGFTGQQDNRINHRITGQQDNG